MQYVDMCFECLRLMMKCILNTNNISQGAYGITEELEEHLKAAHPVFYEMVKKQ